ncbi:MAG: hypothetical protein NTU48_02430 [Legionellales bacterium]|nr:hypothetical protein [Legionellales bacterium]
MAQTNDIERFLYRKLVTYPNVTIVNTERAHPITAVGRGESGSADFIQLSQ